MVIMAKLDTRIWPLLEILGQSGLDWLAQDIFETVIQNGVEVECQHRLVAERPAGRPSKERAHDDVRSQILEGDAQLKWAVDYVTDRLRQVVKLAYESLNMIDQIAGEPQGEATGGSSKALGDRSGTVIALAGMLDEQLDRERLEATFEPFERLEAALRDWLNQTLDQGSSDAE
jgi:hypothetical protein